MAAKVYIVKTCEKHEPGFLDEVIIEAEALEDWTDEFGIEVDEDNEIHVAFQLVDYDDTAEALNAFYELPCLPLRTVCQIEGFITIFV